MAKLGERSLQALPALITATVRDVTLSPDGDVDALTIVPVDRTAFERGDPARTALLDEFIAHRLLTAEDMDGSVCVRPVHEALLRVVPAAVDVLKENAALIRVRYTLDPMVAEWLHAPEAKKADFLATSPALVAGAAQLGERLGEDIPATMRAFIVSSLDADFRRRAASASRMTFTSSQSNGSPARFAFTSMAICTRRERRPMYQVRDGCLIIRSLSC